MNLPAKIVRPVRLAAADHAEDRRPWTTAETARFLSVRPATILAWARSGKLEPLGRTPGGHYRFDPTTVEALLIVADRVPLDLARAIVKRTRPKR